MADASRPPEFQEHSRKSSEHDLHTRHEHELVATDWIRSNSVEVSLFEYGPTSMSKKHILEMSVMGI